MMIRMALLSLCTSVATACATLPDAAVPEQAARASGSEKWSGLNPLAHDHVNRRLDQIEALPVLDRGVLFVGDSITEGAPLNTMFPNLTVANHGISWDTTEGVALRLKQLTRNTPDRLFLLIGTNDTNYTDDPDRISGNILAITDALADAMPTTELYVVSVLPRGGPGNAVITKVNARLQMAAETRPFVYLDLATAMRAPNGEMRPELSYDNLHLNVHGYAVWESELGDCVWQGCPNGLVE